MTTEAADEGGLVILAESSALGILRRATGVQQLRLSDTLFPRDLDRFANQAAVTPHQATTIPSHHKSADHSSNGDVASRNRNGDSAAIHSHTHNSRTVDNSPGAASTGPIRYRPGGHD